MTPIDKQSFAATSAEEARPAALKTQIALPEHLVAMPGGQWTLWRWACLRGAGFPSHLIEKLAGPACPSAADLLLRMEQEAERKQDELIAALQRELQNAGDDESRKTQSRYLKQARKGRFTEPATAAAEPLRQEAMAALSRLESARASFQNAFSAATREVSRQIMAIAADESFRQAILLQNQNAFRHVLHSFTREQQEQPRRGFKERQNQELIASYLQRYCLKNDTVGFFGPVGWAKIDPTIKDIHVRPGPGLITSSSIYFENWCIETLAEKLAEDKRLRPWLMPRRFPFAYLEGNTLHQPAGKTALSSGQVAVLQSCAGDLTARQIAAKVLAMPDAGLKDEEEVYEILRHFAAKRIVAWTLEIPISLEPERRLRQLLERVEPEELRAPALQALEEIEQARDNISKAVGNATALDGALSKLDEVFTRRTGKPATRLPGGIYAGRTLIYQDCRRDLELEIGAKVIEDLSAPLSLILTSARWFSYEVAIANRNIFEQIYRDLLGPDGQGPVGFLQFWIRVQPFLIATSKRASTKLVPEFQRRWQEVLALPPGARRVHYRSEDLRARVEEVFAAPHSGWRLARYHSPDVMIAATDADAIRRGDYSFVMGEVHITINTLRYSFVVAKHPEPEQLFQAIRSDFPLPRLIMVAPRQLPGINNRTFLTLTSPDDYYLEISRDSIANKPRSQVLSSADLVIVDSPRGLMVRTRDGRLEFDILEVFGEWMSAGTVECMEILGHAARVPRVSVDKMVIFRESWSFSAEELKFIHDPEEHERYLGARAWMRRHDLPRYVFVKVAVERKPFFVDFDSTIYVEILVKAVRRVLASEQKDTPVTVTEMLPSPDQLWLRDAQNQTYTSELRIVARDSV